MAHRASKYDAYRPEAPTSRLEGALRRGDHYTPDGETSSDDYSSYSSDASIAPWKPPHSSDAARDTRNPNYRGIELYNLPSVYDPAIDDLIGRTLRAYHLVVKYKDACPDGRRWSPEHIEMIRQAGKNLDFDASDLRRMHGTLRNTSVNRIRYEAHKLRDYCREIQDLIKVHEQHPVAHNRAGRRFDEEYHGQEDDNSKTEHDQDEDTLRQRPITSDQGRQGHKASGKVVCASFNMIRDLNVFAYSFYVVSGWVLQNCRNTEVWFFLTRLMQQSQSFTTLLICGLNGLGYGDKGLVDSEMLGLE